MDRESVCRQWERDRVTFHRLLVTATADQLRRPSNGTRWTNRQLLFHLLFGYQVVRALRPLVAVVSRLPEPASRAFARLLNAVTGPFDVINYLGSCGGALLPTALMDRWLDRIIEILHRRLDTADETWLASGMHFPDRWDPFFAPYMTLADLYRYPAQHFAFHQRQLTLARPETGGQ